MTDPDLRSGDHDAEENPARGVFFGFVFTAAAVGFVAACIVVAEFLAR